MALPPHETTAASATAAQARRRSKGRRDSIQKLPRQKWGRWAEFWSTGQQRPYWDNGNGRPQWRRPDGWPHPGLGAPSPNGGDDPQAPTSGATESRPTEAAHQQPRQPEPPVPADEGVIGAGRSFLTNFAKNHAHWLWGGLAEILHNSVDAKATTIDIQRFPEPATDPSHPDFALRLSDDGTGMTPKEVTTMMQMSSDAIFSGETKQVLHLAKNNTDHPARAPARAARIRPAHGRLALTSTCNDVAGCCFANGLPCRDKSEAMASGSRSARWPLRRPPWCSQSRSVRDASRRRLSAAPAANAQRSPQWWGCGNFDIIAIFGPFLTC